MPGRKSGKGGPTTQGWHAFPAPSVGLGHQVWLDRGKGPRLSFHLGWVTLHLCRDSGYSTVRQVSLGSQHMVPTGLDSASEPLSECSPRLSLPEDLTLAKEMSPIPLSFLLCAKGTIIPIQPTF